jgi:hypothetical protein
LVIYPDVEMSLLHWETQTQIKGIKMTGELIKGKAHCFAELNGITCEQFLSLSNGWLKFFKACHMLKEYQYHGEAASVPWQLQKITVLYEATSMDKTGHSTACHLIKALPLRKWSESRVTRDKSLSYFQQTLMGLIVSGPLLLVMLDGHDASTRRMTES